MVFLPDYHMGSIGDDFESSNNETLTSCDGCTALSIPCYVAVSTDQRFRPLECANCVKEQQYCIFIPPIIGKPPLPLSNNCTECQCAHQHCVFANPLEDDCCIRCTKKDTLCVFAPLKQGHRRDLKM